MKIKQIGSITKPRKNFDNPNDGRVYCPSGISPSINTCGGNREPMIVDERAIVSSRGRNPDNPSDRTAGGEREQRLEANNEGISFCLTSVQKDNMVLEKIRSGIGGSRSPEMQYIKDGPEGGGSWVDARLRIRKLTPLECWRLMGFPDEDFRKAESVCSNSQLYKQAGNSIVVEVLKAIFTNLNIRGCTEEHDGSFSNCKVCTHVTCESGYCSWDL